MAMSKRFDYDVTDISRAYAAARTLTDERARIWAAYLRRELQDSDSAASIGAFNCRSRREANFLTNLFGELCHYPDDLAH